MGDLTDDASQGPEAIRIQIEQSGQLLVLLLLSATVSAPPSWRCWWAPPPEPPGAPTRQPLAISSFATASPCGDEALEINELSHRLSHRLDGVLPPLPLPPPPGLV